jgi:hypothetical protein
VVLRNDNDVSISEIDYLAVQESGRYHANGSSFPETMKVNPAKDGI